MNNFSNDCHSGHTTWSQDLNRSLSDSKTLAKHPLGLPGSVTSGVPWLLGPGQLFLLWWHLLTGLH